MHKYLLSLFAPFLFLSGYAQLDTLQFISSNNTTANFLQPLKNNQGYVCGISDVSDSLVHWAQPSLHKISGRLLLLDPSGDQLKEIRLGINESNIPDTNYTIQDLQVFQEEVWVLLDVQIFENDTSKNRYTELRQYDTNLEIIQKTIFPDELFYRGYSLTITQDTVYTFGNSSLSEFADIENRFMVCKTLSKSSNSVTDNRISYDELGINEEYFVFNKNIAYNSTLNEFFWVAPSITPKFIIYSPINGFRTKNVNENSPINPQQIYVDDQIVVVGEYFDPFTEMDYIAVNVFFANYTKKSSPLRIDVHPDSSVSLSDIAAYTNAITISLNQRQKLNSSSRRIAKILCIGNPVRISLEEQHEIEIDGNFYSSDIVFDENGSIHVSGKGQIESKSELDIGIVFLNLLNKATSITDQGNSLRTRILTENPVRNRVFLNDQLNFPITYKTLNMIGQVLDAKTLNRHTEFIETTSYPKGNYILNCIDRRGVTYSEMFIKQ